MLDPELIRQKPNLVKAAAAAKGFTVDVAAFLRIDGERRKLQAQLDQARAALNRGSRQVARSKGREKTKLRAELRKLKEVIAKNEKALGSLTDQWQALLSTFPNIPSETVPPGATEAENVVVRTSGKPSDFAFPIRDHLSLGEQLGLLDVSQAAKVAGSRSFYLLGDAVLLELALVQLAVEEAWKAGFLPVIPPVFLKRQAELGAGYLHEKNKDDFYEIPRDDLIPTPTAEHGLLAFNAEKIFEEDDLPQRLAGFSTNFRREAGSWGRDVRGIFRVHQFDKVELFSVVKPEDSVAELERLVRFQEELWQKLELPYRVVHLCSGELSMPTAEQYDIETWIPSQGRFRETHSASSTTDFQARRLHIKVRRKDGRSEYVHTLNATALAIPRTLIALLENFQEKDGSVRLPKALADRVGFSKIPH